MILISACSNLFADELTSENHPKLKVVFEKVPKTDGNGDGILTLGELRDYVQTNFRDRATSRFNLYLGQFLKNEPEADKNHDGVLTKSELLAHLQDPRV